MKASLFALAAAAMQAAAECPNACSGKGECGVHDQCTCYAGYTGNDCSQRLCPVGNAFVDTPIGDLNHDGYLMADTTDTKRAKYSTVAWSRYRQYEYWPTTSGVDGTTADFVAANYGGSRYDINPSTIVGGGWAAAPGEAHFRVECSGKGVCERDSGLCQCYDGYTGSACQRTACPNDCSGHGLCRTVAEIADGALNKRFVDSVGGINTYAGVLNPFTYRLWDAEKNRACVCDYGYTGPDCSMRECPRGDDPLTTSKKNCGGADCRKEVQTFIVAKESTTKTYRLQFNDFSGNAFVTDDINFMITGNADANLGTTTANIAAALEGLPNGITGGVTVTATPIGDTGSSKAYILFKVTFDDLPGNVPEMTLLKGQAANGGTGILAQPSQPVQSITFKATSGLAASADLFARVFPTDLTGLSTSEVSGTYETAAASAAADIVTEIQKVFGDSAKGVRALTYRYGATPVKAVFDEIGDKDTVYLVMPDKRFGANVADVEAASSIFSATVLVSVDGNEEFSVCSNRGLCDYSSGLCKCFPGYAGNSCNTQSALAM